MSLEISSSLMDANLSRHAIESLSIESKYLSQSDIEEHRAAMQQVLEDEKREREAINYRRKKAFEKAQSDAEAVKKAEDKANQELKWAKSSMEKKLAAMQRDFECLNLLRRVYHEAPDDVFEMILLKCSDLGNKYTNRRMAVMGSFCDLREANKRCKLVVEACTIRLSALENFDGPELLPIALDQRCRRIEGISCNSKKLKSVVGCPNGLKSLLLLGFTPHLSDLSPLASCPMLKYLSISGSSVTDISVVSSLPLLETFDCIQEVDPYNGRPSISDLSPLSSCPGLKFTSFVGNSEVKDLSPLSACTALEVLKFSCCPRITSLAPLSALLNLEDVDCSNCSLIANLVPLASLTNLRGLDFAGCPLIASLSPLSACTALEYLTVSRCPLINDLAPLSRLINLKVLKCSGICRRTSLLPLETCTKLKSLICHKKSVDLEELKRRRPDLKVHHYAMDGRG